MFQPRNTQIARNKKECIYYDNTEHEVREKSRQMKTSDKNKRVESSSGGDVDYNIKSTSRRNSINSSSDNYNNNDNITLSRYDDNVSSASAQCLSPIRSKPPFKDIRESQSAGRAYTRCGTDTDDRAGFESIPNHGTSTNLPPLLSKSVDNKLYRKKMKMNKLETVKRSLHKSDKSSNASNSTEVQNLRALLLQSQQKMEGLDGLIVSDMSNITQIGMLWYGVVCINRAIRRSMYIYLYEYMIT
jgi:hypothetical protein